MARQKVRPEEDNAQDEMTVVILRYKGKSETLQKGFDTVSQALAALSPPPVVRTVAARKPQEIAAGSGTADAEQTETLEDFHEQDETTEAPRTTRPSGQRKEKWKFLSDFNMDGDGTQFKDFATLKGELGQEEKYMVSALWLHNHGGLENFSGNHIFTCFRTMGWKTRDDLTRPMRRMKKEKSYFDRLARGQWKLNSHGMKAAEAIGTTQ